MFLKIVLILDFVYCLQSNDNNETLYAEAANRPHYVDSEEGSFRMDSTTSMVIIVLFITLLCLLSVVALLFGFRKGTQSIRSKSEKENESHLNGDNNSGKPKAFDGSSNRVTDGTSLPNLESVESGVSVSDSNETIRSLSSEGVDDKNRPKGSPTTSEVLAYSTPMPESSSTGESTQEKITPDPTQEETKPEPTKEGIKPEPTKEGIKPEPTKEKATPEPTQEETTPEPPSDEKNKETDDNQNISSDKQ